MQKSAIYPPIYVLGNGQLGRMLRYAGAPLDIEVKPLAFDAPVFELEQNSIITAEIERWAETPLTQLLGNHKNFVNLNVFGTTADRFTQKSLLDKLQLSTSPWQLLESAEQWQSVFSNVGEKVVVKRRTGGYDGRGQWIVTQDSIDQITSDLFGEVIAEKFIPFDGEISIVGARFRDGSTRFYPISHNLQQNGILRYSVCDENLPNQQTYQTQAEQMLGTIMQDLEYIGVMAMECFVVGDKLLINELAPRVHNSGHWTQLGCSISQFELHLRALLDLPTPQLKQIAPSVMINLIGIEHNNAWLEVPFSQLHWYGKEVRAGRKVGHINLCHPEQAQLIQLLEQLRPYLTDDFHSGLDWAINKLK
ncbi:5-(carboxyamino)imidazole ribonucleotide synthase [Actinobacillus pleuropneumoniae]|uniref:N5-carboxyaminoimidazole ribonucleotide synthase n=1 Tax=Actinobacillus pleuropneumoniae serotype 7 (strain AP76) TaxID=537457 RepID=B3H184_ACTP7|nr:5-(carboxyamino)imidazole ribonucleotide synthase [Actinobacillus pleuropneumoniae]ACE61353.1 phosphoribosylaminoimidazole carboxylase ATPase subunit [Actinobacillus pleuropneumoniae serovar 7 str. AP76]EFM96634.1 Phosphoribosylaminoimidazole carboxylase ATPase subunit [Actinobacillus pleuropneumoniae serovar 10 str. D13039]EFN01000.1 Phosphoribosylaminoimidazole carboxylase ATPase subunit [Actinobacillus pleuropneumoniae serovar 12 str. 1096]EFN03086.1 Phosphoribosylaminoimidazole carboxyla